MAVKILIQITCIAYTGAKNFMFPLSDFILRVGEPYSPMVITLLSLSLPVPLTYSYERTIIDLNHAAQRNNPELVVCTKQSRLRKQVAQLRFITKELNIVSGVQPCSSDDEDCVDTVPHTCNYFQFPDTYEYEAIRVPDTIDTGSGSGSGSENEGFESNDDEDVCAEGIVGGEVTPTIIIGPDTTDTIDTTDITDSAGGNKTRIAGSGAERLTSTTSLLTLFLFAAVSSMFMTSSNR